MNLTSHFLIAMPGMTDPNFSQTINLICSHDAEGAMGLILNRPTSLTLTQMLSEHFASSDNKKLQSEKIVYQGGPVATDQGFVLYRDEREWGDTLRVGDDYLLTTSSEILDAIAEDDGPDHYQVLLGYCGWDAGQLDQEINNNAWLTIAADLDTVFHTPSDKQWLAAAAKLGVDLNLMSTDYGHA